MPLVASASDHPRHLRPSPVCGMNPTALFLARFSSRCWSGRRQSFTARESLTSRIAYLCPFTASHPRGCIHSPHPSLASPPSFSPSAAHLTFLSPAYHVQSLVTLNTQYQFLLCASTRQIFRDLLLTFSPTFPDYQRALPGTHLR